MIVDRLYVLVPKSSFLFSASSHSVIFENHNVAREARKIKLKDLHFVRRKLARILAIVELELEYPWLIFLNLVDEGGSNFRLPSSKASTSVESGPANIVEYR